MRGGKTVLKYNRKDFKMYRTTLLLASLSLLTACGGDSTSTSTGTGTNTLSLMAKYRDACGNETAASDAALLIHNSDYSNKEIIYADVNGKLTYQAENSSQTISIVMRGADEVSGVKPVILTTFMDYPMKDIGNYYHHTNKTDDCDCQNFALNVNVPARVNDRASGRISGVEATGQISNNIGSTFFDNLFACKAPSDQWPSVSAMMNFTNPDESFGVFISDISNSVEVTAELEGIAVDITTNDDDAYRRVSTVIDGKPYFDNFAFNTTGNVYAFPSSLVDQYAVSSYNVELPYMPGADEGFFLTMSTENTSELNKTFDLPLPTIEYSQMFDILVNDSGQYNLSQTNMDSINIGIKAFKGNELMLAWNLYAPTSGQVPAIENIDITAFISDNILDASVTKIKTSALVAGFSDINGYQDFINNMAVNTSINPIQSTWPRSEVAFLDITITDVSLSSSTSPINISKIIKKHISTKGTNKASSNVMSKQVTDIYNIF